MCEASLRGGTEERSARLSMIVIRGRLIGQANWPALTLSRSSLAASRVARERDTAWDELQEGSHTDDAETNAC